MAGTAVYAQDKYALKSPDGIAFSDFKGYEDWAVVSSARTDEVLKVIVANPAMIEAYKAGIPGNGQPFPEGSKIAKLQWKPKKSTEAPFAVDVPDVFTQAFVMEKDSQRFPKSGGWGYALFNYEAASDAFTADPSPSDCGHSWTISSTPTRSAETQESITPRRGDHVQPGIAEHMRHKVGVAKDLRKRVVANAQTPGIGAEGRHHEPLAVAGKTTPLHPSRPRGHPRLGVKMSGDFARLSRRLVAEHDRSDRDFARDDAAEVGGQRGIVIAGNPDPVATRLQRRDRLAVRH